MPGHSPHAASDPAERVLLAVPYAEMDEAKAHGARWDADRCLWWIDCRHVRLLPGIYRWIVDNPGLRAEAEAATKERRALARAPQARRPSLRTPVTTAQTTFLLPSCDCPVAPWEACKHTATDGQAALEGVAMSNPERLWHEPRLNSTPPLPALVTWKSSRLGPMFGGPL